MTQMSKQDRIRERVGQLKQSRTGRPKTDAEIELIATRKVESEDALEEAIQAIPSARKEQLIAGTARAANEAEEEFLQGHRDTEKAERNKAAVRQGYLDRGEPVPRYYWTNDEETSALNLELRDVRSELASLNSAIATENSGVQALRAELATLERSISILQARPDVQEYQNLEATLQTCETNITRNAHNEQLLAGFMQAKGLGL